MYYVIMLNIKDKSGTTLHKTYFYYYILLYALCIVGSNWFIFWNI
ncbi:hypothetical protein BvCmsSIP038_04026 [Escherichia coli]|nr:hypothetical protein BvCmsSIP038_04026 [Escherichia coli]